MLLVENLCKSFHAQRVLSDISLKFEQGKVNMLIGKSGGGKSVLLKILLGLLSPDSGKVFYHGRDFFALRDREKKEVRQKIGMVFQNSALFDSLNVEENLMLPMNLLTKESREYKLARVNEVLARVNLVNANRKFPSELSGGMQKRVAIARALVLKPAYLFCDEPNSGLDPRTSLVIDELIQRLTLEQNMTTVVITHDMNSLMEISDNIFFLSEGRISWRGKKDEIASAEQEDFRDYVFASGLMQGLRQWLNRKV